MGERRDATICAAELAEASEAAYICRSRVQVAPKTACLLVIRSVGKIVIENLVVGSEL